MTAKRVAVLGATGCIGRHVCAAFAERGDHVIAIARRPVPHVAQYEFVPMDIGREFVPPPDIDVVVNAVTGWGRTEQAMHELNVLPTDNVINALRGTSARLVHIGTIHEYGPVPHGTAITESTEPRPSTLYAKAKLVASQHVLRATAAGEISGVVIRLANTHGPFPATESFLGALAVKFHDTDVSSGLELTIANAERDYVDVRDAVNAIVLAAHNPAADPLVNIGRGEALDVRTLVQELLKAAGLPADTVRERTGEVHSRGGDWTRFDISHAARTLGWRPSYDVAESMKAMWDSLDAEELPPPPEWSGSRVTQ